MTRALFRVAGFVLALAFGARAASAATSITFTAEDGVQLAATVWDPATRTAPAVVLVPSATRTRAEWSRLGEQLAARGIVALALDLRGHGGSQGSDPGEDRASLARDVVAAIRYLNTRTDVQVGSVGVAGASLGATLAVLASSNSPVRSLALLSPALDYRGLRIEELLKRVGDRPAFIVASNEDTYAARTARTLAQTGGGLRELLLLEGAGNGTRMLAARPDLVSALVDWFSRTLL